MALVLSNRKQTIGDHCLCPHFALLIFPLFRGKEVSCFLREDHFSSMLVFSFFLELLFFSANTLQVLLFFILLPFPLLCFLVFLFFTYSKYSWPLKNTGLNYMGLLKHYFFLIVNTTAIHNQWLVTSKEITDMEGCTQISDCQRVAP